MSKFQLSQAEDTSPADLAVRSIKDHTQSGQSLVTLSPQRHVSLSLRPTEQGQLAAFFF
ncbi:hypothetical protein FOXYSP1_00314 [Fusarium oxysporum f. sp. phaseoli]